MNQKIHRGMLILIPLGFLLLNPWQLSELGLWIGYGQHLWKDWHFLYQDNVSTLPTDNNIASAWLVALFDFAAFKMGGLYAVVALHAGVLLWSLRLIYRRSAFQVPWPWTLPERAAIYAMWMGSCAYFSLRPALFSFLPFALVYLVLETCAAKGFTKRDWLKIICLQILWVNVHPSFVMVPVITLWTILANRRFKLLNFAGLAVTAGAILINPWGYQIVPYVFKTIRYGHMLGISEWVPVFSREYLTQTVCFLGLVAILVWMRRTGRLALTFWQSPFLPLLVAPFEGLRTSVYSFFALPVFLHLNANLFRAREAKAEPPLSGSIVAAATLTALIAASSPPLKSYTRAYLPDKIKETYDEYSIPRLASRIAASPNECAVLNQYEVGGFLMMSIANPLLIDGRSTPFTEPAIRDYLMLANDQNVENILRQTSPCFAIFSSTQYPRLVHDLEIQFGFHKLDEEKGFVLMSRRGFGYQ